MDEIRIGPAAPDRTAPVRHAPVYDGRIGDLTRIALSNGLLSLVTLGFYRFWGKTRLRRYLWSHVSFLGDRLEYSGTGRELLLGFMVAIAVLLPLLIAAGGLQFLLIDNPPLLAAKEIVQLLLFVCLIYFAIYRARRYRLTRTRWRGIRGAQSGSAIKYALLAFGWLIVTVITLGLAYPVYRTALQRYKTTNTWFGDRPLRFDGLARHLFWSWFVAWLFLIPSLGLTYLWYRAKEFRYFASKTGYGRLGFASNLTFMKIFVVLLVYYLSIMVLLGLVGAFAAIFVPEALQAYMELSQGNSAALAAEDLTVILTLVALIAITVVLLGVLAIIFFLHPLFAAVLGTLTVLGEEDYAAIAQSRQAVPGRGEGLADTLDVGAF